MIESFLLLILAAVMFWKHPWQEIDHKTGEVGPMRTWRQYRQLRKLGL